LLLTIVINRERNCSNDSYKRSRGNFKRGGGKNPLLSMTLSQFAQRKKERKKKTLFFYFLKTNNQHRVDVIMVMVI
jgi:hypothetical protein